MKFTITDSPNPNFWAIGSRLTQDEAVKVLGLRSGDMITPSRMAARMLSLGFHFRIEMEQDDSRRKHSRFQNAADYCLPRDF